MMRAAAAAASRTLRQTPISPAVRSIRPPRSAATKLSQPRCLLRYSAFHHSVAATGDKADLSSTDYDSTASLDDAGWEDGIVTWEVPPGGASRRVVAKEGAPPFVILPGFGHCSSDYTNPFGQCEASLVAALESRGFRAYVVPIVKRSTWLRITRSLFTHGFWSASLTTDPGYTWYLQLVDETVKKVLRDTGSEQVDLIGHSAGGWLGRAYIGDVTYFEPSAINESTGNVTANTSVTSSSLPPAPTALPPPLHTLLSRVAAVLPSLPPPMLPLPLNLAAASTSNGSSSSSGGTNEGGGSSQPSYLQPPSRRRPNPRVRSLITLGTPQRPVPPGRGQDRTGGALSWVHTTYPGAFFAADGVRYVSVGGRTVRGRRRQLGEKSSGPHTYPHLSTLEYAYNSYEQVCGEGQDIEGDAVVPLRSTFLSGARHQVLLDGVWHSMSRVGTFDEDSGVVWYGSDAVVDSWLWTLEG